MSAVALATALAPLASGALYVDLRTGSGQPMAARVCGVLLGAGLGLGLDSCAFFAWSLAFGTDAPGLRLIEWLLAVLLMASWARRRSGVLRGSRATVSPPRDLTRLTLLAAFAVTACAGAWRFAERTAARPHGGWDAWAIWNFHARWIARGGDDWLGFLALDHSQPSYPLLLPLSIAHVWHTTGGESQAVPIGLAACFAAATLGILVSELTARRDLALGLLGGIALAATPSFLVGSASLYADIPLGFFVLGTAVQLHRGLSQIGDRRAFALAGLCAGLGAWTKDEGWLLAGATLAIAAAWTLRSAGPRATLRCVGAIGLGLAPALLVAGGFKLWLAPPGWLATAPVETSLLARVTDLERGAKVATAFAQGFFELGPLDGSGAVRLSFPVLLGVLPWIVARRPRFRSDPAALAVLALAGALLAGYAAVILATPFDLDWQLRTSLSRLITQVWPSLLFGWLLLVPTLPALRSASPP